MATQQQSFVEERRGDTLVNVLIGAVAAFVLGTFVPVVGYVGGGAVAGYLQQQSRASGAKVGAIATALAALPGVLLAILFLGLGTLGAFGGGDAGSGILMLVFLVVAVVVGMAIAAGLGALGGYVGAAVAEE